MGNAAARSHRIFPGSEILVPLVASTVVFLYSAGSGLCSGSLLDVGASPVAPVESCRWSSKEAMCSHGTKSHHTARAAALPVRHPYKVLTIYGYLRSQCTFWKLSLFNPCMLAKIYFKWYHSAFPVLFQMEMVLANCTLFQTACWALLFWNSWYFPETPCCADVWSLCIPPCVTGMEWGLINYDQIIISEVKRRVSFHGGYHGGQGWLLCVCYYFGMPACKNKGKCKASPCWRCLCSENSFSWRGECILTAVSSRV